MSQQTTLKNTRFLQEATGGAEQSMSRMIGPTLVTNMLRLLKTGEMFAVEHAQTRQAAEELVVWLAAQHEAFNEDTLSLQLTDTSIFLNGQLIKMDEHQYARSIPLRTAFLAINFNQIQLMRGLVAGELIALLLMLREARQGQQGMAERFEQPHLRLSLAGKAAEEEAPEEEDARREILSLYAGLLIKTATYFQQLRRISNPSARFVKRFVQKITDHFGAHRHVFIGLINMRLVPGQDFVHAVNTALYAMFLAHEIGMDRLDVVRVGMTSITQDIHKLRQHIEEPDSISPGQDAHFTVNMTSVTMLSEMGVSDVLSALRLVTGYERGFPYQRPLPPAWYREERRPHLLSRIVELARHYDIFVQGLDGQRGLSPDMALQAIMLKTGAHYDPDLARLFINIIGIYPVGSQVLLSTGERALVVRSPTVGDSHTAQAVAHRPVVRLNATGRLLDLSLDEHRAVRIASLLEGAEALEDHPGAFAFF